MCLAMNPDKLKPGERCASTSNRNFEGRQGYKGRTHLVSPAMAAARGHRRSLCRCAGMEMNAGLPGRLKAQDPPSGGSFLLEQASVAGPHTMRVGQPYPSPAAIGAVIGGVESKTGPTPSATQPPKPPWETTETPMPAAASVPTTTTMPTAAAVPCRSSAGMARATPKANAKCKPRCAS